MNNRTQQRVARVLFFSYLLFFLLFFLYSFFTLPGDRLLRIFTWPYVWINAFILFIDWLLAISVSAVLIAHSLFFGPRETAHQPTGRAQPFHRLVSGNLVLFIVLTLIYTVLVIGFHPLAHQRRNRLFSLSRQAEFFLASAEQAVKRDEHASALYYYDRYLAIDRRSVKVQELRAEAQAKGLRQARHQAASPPGLEPPDQPGPLLEMTAAELLERAQSYYTREDYFSAHYYATLAARLDESDLRSKSLAARAWEKIAGLEATAADREARNLFARKKQGYAAFINRDYISAYYLFKDLLTEYPQDPDIKNYYTRSKAQAAEISFFKDEAEKVMPLPGEEELLFVNSRDQETREILFIAKMVVGEGGVYFKDLEAIRFRAAAGIVYHWRASYGKLMGDHINLSAIDRKDRKESSLPVYLGGDDNSELKNMLFLGPTPAVLPNLGRDLFQSAQISLDFLWRHRKEFGSYGYPEEPLIMEILLRLLKPFSFLILCLFSLSLGWSYRTRYLARPPLLTLLFIPLFPYVIALFTSFYLAAQKILLGFLLVSLGLAIALLVLVLLQGILLIASLVLLAGQRND